MHLFASLLTIMLPLFGLVAVGYIAKKLRILHITDAEALNRFVVIVLYPATIIDAFVQHHFAPSYFKLPPLMWAATAAGALSAFGLAKALRWDAKATGAAILVAAFGNTAFLGYPLTIGLHKELLPATIVLDQIGMVVIFYPLVAAVASVYGRTDDEPFWTRITKQLRAPMFVALLIGLAIKFIPVPQHLPGALVFAGRQADTLMHLMGQATVPVVLIAIGVRLRPSALRDHGAAVALLGVLRLIVAPVAAWATAKYVLGVHGDLLQICVLIAAMPPSAAATVMIAQFEMDSSLAVAAFFALTIASALTVPLMLTLLR